MGKYTQPKHLYSYIIGLLLYILKLSTAIIITTRETKSRVSL